MKWNISVISGKETKKYFVSTGEGMQIKKFLKILSLKIFLIYEKITLCKTKEGNSPVL